MKHFLFLLVGAVGLAIPDFSVGQPVKKTYLGKELVEKWCLFDPAQKHVQLEWQPNASINYANHTYGIDIRSKDGFAGVSKVDFYYHATPWKKFLWLEKINFTNVRRAVPKENQDKSFSGYTFWSKSETDSMNLWGQISLTTTVRGWNEVVTVDSIVITYDPNAGKRELKWSTSAAETILGESYSPPTLTGNYTKDVYYTSSNNGVATVDYQTGTVRFVDEGETYITAHAPRDGVWWADSVSYLLKVKQPASFVAEKLHVNTPGTLQDLLLDLPSSPQKLVVSGKLNSVDLKYLNSATGKISTVTDLDLSAVTFDYDDGVYATISGGYGDVGMSTETTSYYLSDKYSWKSESKPNGLGGSTTVTSIHTNSLSCLFYDNKKLERVVLPAQLDSIGSSIFANSAVRKVVLPPRIRRIPNSAFARASQLTFVENYANLTAVEDHAFEKTQLAEFNLPENCTTLGEGAFAETKLSHVDLSHVTAIGEKVFCNTPLVDTLDLRNFTVIPVSAFEGCQLTGLHFSSRLRTIGSQAFFNNSRLSCLNLPEGLESVEDYAFHLCSDLIEITLPQSLISIGREAFPSKWIKKQASEDGIIYLGRVAYQMESKNSSRELRFKEGTVSVSPSFGLGNKTVRRIVFPSSLRYIGNKSDCNSYAFANMDSLESVSFNEGLLQIGMQSFYNCPRLSFDKLPESLEYIGRYAFKECNVQTLVLGKNLKYLGGRSFQGCPIYSLKLYTPHLICGDWYSDDPWAESDEFSIPQTALEVVTIGAGVEKIPGSFLGYYAKNLRRLIIEPSDLPLVIGKRAFSGLPLAISNFPRKIVRIEEGGFANCTFSTQPDLSECTYFGKDALYEAKGLDFELSDKVTYIGDKAFYNAHCFRQLKLTPQVAYWGNAAFRGDSLLHTIYYNIPRIEQGSELGGLKLLADCPNVKKITIGPDVEIIYDRSFSRMKNVDSLLFEPRDKSSALRIESLAFSGKMRTIVLPDCRTAFGGGVFRGCKNLERVYLGDGTETISEGHFISETRVVSVDFPASFLAFSSGYISSYRNALRCLYFHSAKVPNNLILAMPRRQSYEEKLDVYVPAEALEAYTKAIGAVATVKSYAIESFSLAESKIRLAEGMNVNLTQQLRFVPQEYDGLRVNWSSDDPSIASVDCFGRVTAHQTGVTNIRAKVAYLEGFTATCQVMVGSSVDIEETEVDDAESITIICDNGKLIIHQAPKGALLRIYTTTGILVAETTHNSVTGLKPGAYIVTVGGQTAKIIVK